MRSFKQFLSESKMLDLKTLDGKSFINWGIKEFENYWKKILMRWFLSNKDNSHVWTFKSPKLKIPENMKNRYKDRKAGLELIEDFVVEATVYFDSSCLSHTKGSHYRETETYFDTYNNKIVVTGKLYVIVTLTHLSKDDQYLQDLNLDKTSNEFFLNDPKNMKKFYNLCLESFVHELSHLVQTIHNDFPPYLDDLTKNKRFEKANQKVPHENRIQEWSASENQVFSMIISKDFKRAISTIFDRYEYLQKSNLDYKKMITKLSNAGIDRNIISGFIDYGQRYMKNVLFGEYTRYYKSLTADQKERNKWFDEAGRYFSVSEAQKDLDCMLILCKLLDHNLYREFNGFMEKEMKQLERNFRNSDVDMNSFYTARDNILHHLKKNRV